MSSTDNTLDSALWLTAGGAAGYATARWVIAPWLASRSAAKAQPPQPRPSSSGSPAAAPPAHSSTTAQPPRPRALIAGPSGAMVPIDPYAVSSSRTPPHVLVGPPVTAVPIDPYATPSHPNVSQPAATGPITSPSQLDVAASAALGTELATVLTSASPDSGARRPLLPSTLEQTGPITSPAQVTVPAPTGAVPSLDLAIGPVTILPPTTPVRLPSSRLPRRFDAVFDRYRGSIPIEYLRALVARESSFNPLARAGSAIGLMQIVPVVREDYNKRHGTPYQPEHLYDPTINVAIGCELLRHIIASYRRFHPRVPNLQENWDNPRYAELVTFGWNAGFSEVGGVGRVARYLEGLGAVDVTIDQVAAHARAAGASKHLSNPAKVAWCKSVVALYQRERPLALPAQTFVST